MTELETWQEASQALQLSLIAIEGNDAPYLHCASPDLNLVLCHACKVPNILCKIENVRAWKKNSSVIQREYAYGRSH